MWHSITLWWGKCPTTGSHESEHTTAAGMVWRILSLCSNSSHKTYSEQQTSAGIRNSAPSGAVLFAPLAPVDTSVDQSHSVHAHSRTHYHRVPPRAVATCAGARFSLSAGGESRSSGTRVSVAANQSTHCTAVTSLRARDHRACTLSHALSRAPLPPTLSAPAPHSHSRTAVITAPRGRVCPTRRTSHIPAVDSVRRGVRERSLGPQ